MSTPAHTTLSVQQFLTPKMACTPCLTLSIHPFSPHVTFLFVCLNEKYHQKETFGDVEEKKIEEALKDIKINEFKNCFEQWKNISIGVLYQIESTLKVTEV